MSDILDFYKEQASAAISPLSWLQRLKDEALADFTQKGFPTRSHEDWKYTSVDSFLNKRFSLNQTPVKRPETPGAEAVPVGQHVRFSNGVLLNAEEIAACMPAGAIVKPWPLALKEHPELVQPYLGQILAHDHGFQALNTAMLQCGLFIYLPENCHLKTPLVLSHWQDQHTQATYIRHVIVAEAQSQATIIEDYHGLDGVDYYTNAITEVSVGQDATINHYKIQREGSLGYHIGHTAARQAKNSDFNSHVLSLGGKLARSDITIALQQEQARCLLNGIYIPVSDQHIDHHTTVYHNLPQCKSIQDYKGILKGKSRAVFNGKVIVAKDAQQSLAEQQNKNLLLSAKAEIDSKPQLEIFADDVTCTHGATVGQLDEEALFYLATRGINREEASRYMIHAFAADNLKRVCIPELADWMKTLLNRQLG